MPASVEVRYSRLLRPFPVGRLPRILHQVQGEAHLIDRALIRLLTDPPGTPEPWRYELDALAGHLWSLAEYAREAQSRVEVMAVDADRAFRAAVDAQMAIHRGLAATAQEPADAV